MKWIAGAIVVAAFIVGLAITYPFRNCVNGYVAQPGGSEDFAKVVCFTKGG